MSDLDDQLRDAVREVDARLGADEKAQAPSPVLAESPPGLPQPDQEDSHRRRNLGLLLGLLALGGGALSLVLGGSSDSLKFSRSVEEVLATKTGDEGRMLTVEARLVHGSLVKRDEPCEYRFRLRAKDGSSGELTVHYPACIVPDNFRDVAGIDVDVTATGRVRDGVLTADNISTKCPAKYEMQQQQKLGVKAPHADPALGPPATGSAQSPAELSTGADEPKSVVGFDD